MDVAIIYRIWVISEEWRYRRWVGGFFFKSYDVIWTQNQYVSDPLDRKLIPDNIRHSLPLSNFIAVSAFFSF